MPGPDGSPRLAFRPPLTADLASGTIDPWTHPWLQQLHSQVLQCLADGERACRRQGALDGVLRIHAAIDQGRVDADDPHPDLPSLRQFGSSGREGAAHGPALDRRGVAQVVARRELHLYLRTGRQQHITISCRRLSRGSRSRAPRRLEWRRRRTDRERRSEQRNPGNPVGHWAIVKRLRGEGALLTLGSFQSYCSDSASIRRPDMSRAGRRAPQVADPVAAHPRPGSLPHRTEPLPAHVLLADRTPAALRTGARDAHVGTLGIHLGLRQNGAVQML